MSENTQEMIEKIAAAIADGTGLIATDYDGTISPFNSKRMEAFPDEKAKSMLENLENEFPQSILIITGRPLTELNTLLGSDSFNAVGQHGVETRINGTVTKLQLTDQANNLLTIAKTAAKEFAADLIKTRELNTTYDDIYEEKPYSFAFHWRALKTTQQGILDIITAEFFNFMQPFKQKSDQLPAEEHSFQILYGDMNYEFKLDNKYANKGLLLSEVLGKYLQSKKTISWLCDDLDGTDRPAAEKVKEIKGHTIQVLNAKQEHDLATHTVESPQEMGELLEKIYDKAMELKQQNKPSCNM